MRRREFSVTYFGKEQCVQCVNSVCVARRWNLPVISIECTVYNPVPLPHRRAGIFHITEIFVELL